MIIFGLGFRLLLVALAVAVERVGEWARSNPWLMTLIASRVPKVPSDQEGTEEPMRDWV